MAFTSDDKSAIAQTCKRQGKSVEETAELLDLSVSQVYRYWQDAPNTEHAETAVGDLESLLVTQELDEHSSFHAGVARRLAQRLDKIAVSDKAQDALAMPQISKELRAVVADIMGTSQDDKEWLAGLLTTVRHPTDGQS